MTPLVTAEEFSGYLQRDLDRYSAELAVAGASGLVRSYCRWGISRQAADAVVLDGGGSRLLSLPTLKLNDVVSVEVDGVALAADAYNWAAFGQLYRAEPWPVGLRNVAAVIDHGYDEVPDEIRIVTCAIAARYYTNPAGLRSHAVGGTNRTFVAAEAGAGVTLTDLEVALIATHRLP